jgi:hypothetical protein
MTTSDKLWKAIQRELVRAHDIETVILKSHLLVETQLNAALEKRIGNNIERARLRFIQKLELLACMWPALKGRDSSIGARSLYEDWRELNSLRNKIAHQLSPINMRTMLVNWVTQALGYRLSTIRRTSVLKRNVIKVIAFEVAFFSGRVEEWKTHSNK